MLTEVTATRYVTPLREGGSLPGIVEADDLGTYVMKSSTAPRSSASSSPGGVLTCADESFRSFHGRTVLCGRFSPGAPQRACTVQLARR
ncbi:hypothetical protein AAHZ94_00185 [Streptomyces sp. HSW2009]|uniref:hypothetical protein n=1 Tax=Streptomyces sp. HSW2009 TaxID=3142890 RepID=UPI0032ECF08F